MDSTKVFLIALWPCGSRNMADFHLPSTKIHENVIKLQTFRTV